jgi:hypothetical protein
MLILWGVIYKKANFSAKVDKNLGGKAQKHEFFHKLSNPGENSAEWWRYDL